MTNPIAPSWTWGSSATLRLVNTSAESAQLAQVSLPEPAVCSLYIQASMTSAFPVDVVKSFTINLLEGIGRVTVPRQLSFTAQPALNAPLEFTIPFVPVHALQVNVSAVPDIHSVGPGTPEIVIDVYFVLSPLTRIPQKAQELAFGMALPGEADDLDDGLREELETEGPTATQIMMQGQAHAQDSSDGLEPVEQEPEEQEPVELTPIQRVVAAFVERHGRKPTRIELAATVARIKARAARRRGR